MIQFEDDNNIGFQSKSGFFRLDSNDTGDATNLQIIREAIQFERDLMHDLEDKNARLKQQILHMTIVSKQRMNLQIEDLQKLQDLIID